MPEISIAFQGWDRKLLCQFFAQEDNFFYTKATNNFSDFHPLTCYKEIHKFLRDWIRKHDSLLPQTFYSLSVAGQETPLKVSGSTNLPFTKKEPMKLEILSFSPTRKRICKFLEGWIGNHESVLPQTFHSPSLPGQETPVKVSVSTNLPFTEKEPIKLEILSFLPTIKKICKFLEGSIGNDDSVLPQTFYSLSVAGQETLVKLSSSNNLLFTKKKPIKLEILAFLPPPVRKFPRF